MYALADGGDNGSLPCDINFWEDREGSLTDLAMVAIIFRYRRNLCG